MTYTYSEEVLIIDASVHERFQLTGRVEVELDNISEGAGFATVYLRVGDQRIHLKEDFYGERDLLDRAITAAMEGAPSD